MNQTARDSYLAHLTVYLVVRCYETLLERGRVGNNFERRTRLVDVLKGPIRAHLRRVLTRLIRIERRRIRERKNLAGARIHHDGGAGFCTGAFDRAEQGLLSSKLNRLID